MNNSLTRSLKKFVDRRRPKQVERVRMVELAKARPKFLTLFKPVKIRYSDERDRERSGPSFPSGHVTTNTTIAMILALFFRRWGWLYFLVCRRHRVVAGLPRRALAERRARDFFPGRWVKLRCLLALLRSALPEGGGALGPAVFRQASTPRGRRHRMSTTRAVWIFLLGSDRAPARAYRCHAALA